MWRNGGLFGNALAGHALQDHGRVGAPETERIRERDIDLAFARRLRHEINRRFYRRVVKIDGWRRDIIANRKDTEDRLERSGGTQKMPGRRFGRGHRDLGSGGPAQPFPRPDVYFVTDLRRGAMRIDVVDVGRTDAGALHGSAHAPERAIAIRR